MGKSPNCYGFSTVKNWCNGFSILAINKVTHFYFYAVVYCLFSMHSRGLRWATMRPTYVVNSTEQSRRFTSRGPFSQRLNAWIVDCQTKNDLTELDYLSAMPGYRPSRLDVYSHRDTFFDVPHIRYYLCRHKYFRFRRPYCYSRLSVDLVSRNHCL